MATIEGSIDDSGRLLCRLFVCNVEDSVLFAVDTGCSFSLVVERSYAKTLKLGVPGHGDQRLEMGVLASGSLGKFEKRTATVRWFDKEINVRVHIPVDIPDDELSDAERRHAPARYDSEVGVIGFGLLVGTRLLVNYPQRRFRIRQ